jgi:hypothetical protein
MSFWTSLRISATFGPKWGLGMKLISAGALALALFAMPALAQDGEDKCAAYGELAQTIMELRQSGTVMSTLIAAMKSDPNNPAADMAILLIKEAYGRPQFSTEKNKTLATTEFRNDTELACYNATG